MPTCIYTIGSVTQAMKAKKLLTEYSLPINIIKVNNEKHGCVHGIEFSCSYKNNIKSILDKHNIKYLENYI